jgi:hypothetical protein
MLMIKPPLVALKHFFEWQLSLKEIDSDEMASKHLHPQSYFCVLVWGSLSGEKDWEVRGEFDP